MMIAKMIENIVADVFRTYACERFWKIELLTGCKPVSDYAHRNC